MERRIERPDRDGKPGHRLEEPVEVVPLEREDLRERLVELRLRSREFRALRLQAGLPRLAIRFARRGRLRFAASPARRAVAWRSARRGSSAAPREAARRRRTCARCGRGRSPRRRTCGPASASRGTSAFARTPSFRVASAHSMKTLNSSATSGSRVATAPFEHLPGRAVQADRLAPSRTVVRRPRSTRRPRARGSRSSRPRSTCPCRARRPPRGSSCRRSP